MTDLPRPTGRAGGRFLGGFGLPAVVLTWASMGVTVTVFAALQATPVLRALFRLPVPPVTTALLAAAAAGVVALRCRERPGRRFPRLWPLILIGVSLLLAIGAPIDPVARGAPWRHAGGLACLAGASVLLARLLPIRPDRRWIEAVAPLGVAGALGLVFLPALVAGWWSFHREVGRLEETIALLRERSQELLALRGEELLDSRPEAARAEERLQAVTGRFFGDRGSLADLWGAASVLGREEELSSSLAEAVAAVAAAFDPAHAPRISSLEEPAVRWDPERKEWVAGSEFRRLSGLVGSFYGGLGALFEELDPRTTPGDAAALAEYRDRYGAERRTLQRHLQATLESWTDHWAVARVPAAGELVGSVEPPLERLLEVPLAAGAWEGVAPADVGRLLALRREDVRALARQAPGCHVRRYREGAMEYERLDCHAFRADPAEGENGAVLRIEMRLVFVGSPRSLSGSYRDSPAELFFLFPVPEDAEAAAFLGEVAVAVADAVRARWRGDLRFLDRGGSTVHGFVLQAGADRIVVYRPHLESFLDDRQAVVVRAERAAG